MKIVSWNINGLKSILKKNFITNINKLNADFICLQETKISEELKNFKLNNYYQYHNFSKKSGYSGVAILAKDKPEKVLTGMELENEEGKICDYDNESRVITLEYNDFYIVSVYVPSSQNGQDRLNYRLTFDNKFNEYIEKLNNKKRVVICGDFNICYRKIDICEFQKRKEIENFKDEEKSDFRKLLKLGFIDTFRFLHPQMRKFSYWTNTSDKNKEGWRLDYILMSEDFRKDIREANILDNFEGSDHCPIEVIIGQKKKEVVSNKVKNNDKVLYIQKGYLKDAELENMLFIRNDLSEEILGKIWRNYDFDKAEKRIFELQCNLTKAIFSRNKDKMKRYEDKIINSTEGKMLAVRKVSEISKSKGRSR